MRFAKLVLTLIIVLSVFCTGFAGTRQTQAQDRLRIGIVMHMIGIPFIQQVLDGARAAAEDLDVALVEAGPQGVDPSLQIAMVEDVVAAGVHGVITSIFDQTMVKPMVDIIEAGTPAVMSNVPIFEVPAPYVGEPSGMAGYLLGQTMLELLGGETATGTAIFGNCYLPSPTLQARAAGAMAAFSVAEGVEQLGPFDVASDALENYGRWEQLLAANPGVDAMVGNCAPDLNNLGRLNKEFGGTFIAGGFDLTEENLKAIEEGAGHVLMGQSPFVQGYLPVLMLVEHIRYGTPLEQGFYNSGLQIVTATTVVMGNDLPELTFEDLIELSADAEATRAYYQPWIDRVTNGGWLELSEPIENEKALPTDVLASD
jgi:ABC-type sugar transport system substrate-binding protein